MAVHFSWSVSLLRCSANLGRFSLNGLMHNDDAVCYIVEKGKWHWMVNGEMRAHGGGLFFTV